MFKITHLSHKTQGFWTWGPFRLDHLHILSNVYVGVKKKHKSPWTSHTSKQASQPSNTYREPTSQAYTSVNNLSYDAQGPASKQHRPFNRLFVKPTHLTANQTNYKRHNIMHERAIYTHHSNPKPRFSGLSTPAGGITITITTTKMTTDSLEKLSSCQAVSVEVGERSR